MPDLLRGTLARPGAPAGLILLGLGVLFLLGNLGLVSFMATTVVAALFCAAGAAFTYAFIRRPEQWWALIPAGALGGVGLTIALAGTPLAGAALLLTLGAAFLLVYVSGAQRWWALIPGGVLSTVALVTVSGPLAGPVLFAGFAVTFGALAFLRPQARWALVPAAVFATIGGLVFAGPILKWLLPLALIGAGALMLRPDLLRALGLEQVLRLGERTNPAIGKGRR